jgi:hypothetical protein
MAIPINSTEPMLQIVFNNSLISYPLFSVSTFLLIVLLFIFSLAAIFLKKLPEHIYKRLEKKLDKETELLKLIRSQVEPRKVDTYLALSDIYGDMIAPQFINQNLNPSERQKELASKRSAFQNLSRLFFFASDKTIEKFLNFKKHNTSPQAMDLFADFMVSMRQDLHEDTRLTAKDFMDVIITWTQKLPESDKK